MGVFTFWKRRRPAPPPIVAETPAKPVQVKKPDRPIVPAGGLSEVTGDLLTRRDGERVGFRKPIQG
jgi:hypothetical protein